MTMKDVKIKATLHYADETITITVVGLVDKQDYEERKEFGLGYIEDSDIMTDAEGFEMHTVLEGQDQLDAYYLISDGGVGYAEVELINQ